MEKKKSSIKIRGNNITSIDEMQIPLMNNVRFHKTLEPNLKKIPQSRNSLVYNENKLECIFLHGVARFYLVNLARKTNPTLI